MVKTLSYNNRSYKCFFTSGMTRPVITMVTANGVTRGVKNPATIAKVLAAIAEEDHVKALEINQKMDTWAQISDLMVKHTTPYAMDAVHAEALEMDAEYRRAIATIADNLSMSVWDGCSDTVKAEVVKHHHAEALEEDYRFHRLKARWWDFWASYSESERQDELEEAHVEALEMNKAHSL
ncbi:hypothetical protein H3Z28_002146 [Salmonella enterica subsp. enterica serovar Ank]|nr:hypothetical protein [Salmonella enterica subsp. enterica serovar Ank]